MEISTDYTLYTGILTKCVFRYIPVTMETIPLLPNIVYSVHYIWIYR